MGFDVPLLRHFYINGKNLNWIRCVDKEYEGYLDYSQKVSGNFKGGIIVASEYSSRETVFEFIPWCDLGLFYEWSEDNKNWKSFVEEESKE